MTKDDAFRVALETADGILNSDWRNWQELSSPEEFERWVKARANHMAIALRQAIEQAEKPVGWQSVANPTGWAVDYEYDGVTK